MRPWLASFAGITALSLSLAGCSGSPATPASDTVAMATTTPLASVLHDITACAGGTSVSLMDPGDDPHTFSVSSEQMASFAKVKVVFANGLGLEEGIADALKNAQADGAKVVELAPRVDPIPFGEAGAHADHDEEHAEEGHEHGSQDPHFWLDVSRMAKAAAVMGEELASTTENPKYAECGEKIAGQLNVLDAELALQFESIPKANRVLVTDHEAFGYFAKRYEFTQAGVVIPGGSTDAEPSSADLAKVVAVVKDHQAKALFSNTAVNPKVVKAVAAEAGTDVKVVPLHVGSVGEPGSPAATYAGMMRENAQLVVDALK